MVIVFFEIQASLDNIESLFEGFLSYDAHVFCLYVRSSPPCAVQKYKQELKKAYLHKQIAHVTLLFQMISSQEYLYNSMHTGFSKTEITGRNCYNFEMIMAKPK